MYTFHYESDEKKVTGVAHLPNGKGPFPIILQFRGYVDKQKYYPGEGTDHSAEVYASNGFISLAPDFLGYGSSDPPSPDAFEDRFLTYTTALNLIASVKTLPMADATKIGIWGHSNGGHIALTVLEILGKSLPASLWAPVSKPFPYSILYYSDEADDNGKALRKELAAFEQNYNVDNYSLTNYFNRLAGPIILHQGSADDAVPQGWSDLLAKTIKGKEKNITYYVYPEADHNMAPTAWNTVVSRDVAFFKKELQ